MLNINNNAASMKREILVKIAKLQLEGKLEDGVHSIPRELAPKDSQSIRCCIYHDREILRQRVESNSPELIAIYGRRRIGKTYLIRQYFTRNITNNKLCMTWVRI